MMKNWPDLRRFNSRTKWPFWTAIEEGTNDYILISLEDGMLIAMRNAKVFYRHERIFNRENANAMTTERMLSLLPA